MSDKITIQDLDDHYFEDLLGALQELTSGVKEDFGESLSLDELLRLLTWGIESLDDEAIQEKSTVRLIELKAKVKKTKKQMLEPGDVFRIPRKGNKCLLVVFLGKTYAGHHFGMFCGEHPVRPTYEYAQLKPYSAPKRLLRDPFSNGEWGRVENNKDVMKVFNCRLEHYHLKKDHPTNDSIGKYGSAENDDGKLRDLSYEEFKELELDHPKYTSGPLPAQMDDFYECFLKLDGE